MSETSGASRAAQINPDPTSRRLGGAVRSTAAAALLLATATAATAACGARAPARTPAGSRPAIDGAASVVGQVVDPAGAPIAGIAVMVGSASARSMAITDEQGLFAVTNLRPGAWEVVVDPCQEDAAVRQVTVRRGQSVRADLQLGAPVVGSRVSRLPTPAMAGGPASALPAPPPPPMSGTGPDEVAAAAAGADEIWIIARPAATSAGAARRRYASGLVCAYVPSAGRDLPLPLADTEVDATVRGWAAEVQVTQRYRNPHPETLEAVYVFSLPDGAAVSGFLATIGGRRIRGIVRDREEAERIYAEARAAGYVAALLTQSRASTFTQRLANVPPGKRIDLELTYHQVVSWADGGYRFAFPAAAPRRAGAGPQPRFAMTVDIEAAAPIASVAGERAAVDVRRLSPTRRLVTLSPDAATGGEYAIGWKVAGEAGASLFVHPGRGERYFAVVLHPAQALDEASLDFGGARVREVYPSHLPDLAVGRPTIVIGKLDGDALPTLTLRGRAGGQAQALRIPVAAVARAHPSLPALWARMKLADLSGWGGPAELADRLGLIAREHGLLGEGSAGVMVDAAAKPTRDPGSSAVCKPPLSARY
jgi:hypothetical protein